MSQIAIFCESYGQIKYALQLAIHNCHDRPVTIVIPGFPDLFQFFKVVNEKVFRNEINLIYLEAYQKRMAAKVSKTKKAFYVFPDIVGERRNLKEFWNKYFAELEACEVFFFSRGFNGLTFYLLKKLSKRNQLLYVSLGSLGPPYWSKHTPRSIIELANLTIWKLIYGHDVTMGRLPLFKGFLYMPDKFIEKEVNRVMHRAEIDEMMKGFDLSQFRIFDVGAHSIIYFDQDLIGVGYITDGDTYKRELTSIFSILGKYFPKEEIALKYHPGSSDDEILAKVGGILPSFIPAELLYNDNVKLYLAIFSRSIANVERGLAVSLADLIAFKSDEIRNKLKEDLIEVSKSKILFPKTLDEFEQILIDLKGQRV